MKRIAWNVEEMVAMVDLYYHYKDDKNENIEETLKKLSEKLNKRADFLNIQHDEKFRNLNGMKMIFENIRYVDTNGQKGLSDASNLIYNILDLYNKIPDVFLQY